MEDDHQNDQQVNNPHINKVLKTYQMSAPRSLQGPNSVLDEPSGAAVAVCSPKAPMAGGDSESGGGGAAAEDAGAGAATAAAAAPGAVRAGPVGMRAVRDGAGMGEDRLLHGGRRDAAVPAADPQHGAPGLHAHPDQPGVRRAAHLLFAVHARAAGHAQALPDTAGDGAVVRPDDQDERRAAVLRAAPSDPAGGGPGARGRGHVLVRGVPRRVRQDPGRVHARTVHRKVLGVHTVRRVQGAVRAPAVRQPHTPVHGHQLVPLGLQARELESVRQGVARAPGLRASGQPVRNVQGADRRVGHRSLFVEETKADEFRVLSHFRPDNVIPIRRP
ncbi:hypothetical protein AGLY_011294 [Aphis glycines]|uniref:Uncharacterized protein n=1 Tax=Aphis glycines TaxID=307491 RepID=A0A6G0TDF4_APHGL|nr:hypothetical protein AGLY_011294 [Aphis glycines]